MKICCKFGPALIAYTPLFPMPTPTEKSFGGTPGPSSIVRLPSAPPLIGFERVGGGNVNDDELLLVR